jgi:cytochrome c oxidase subunit III
MTDHSVVHNHESHLPPSSLWPLILALGLGFLPFGILFLTQGNKIIAELCLIVGAAVTLVSLIGWAHTVVREKAAPGEKSRVLQQTDLMMFLKYFLISETAIFGALFAHYFYHRYGMEFWPPAGTPEIHTHLPAIATLILMLSSVTCEFAHKALKQGNKFRAKTLVLVSAILGLIFLSFQGYEWGLMQTHYAFTVDTNIFGTMFYMMTGFHGLHVSIGIIFLVLVYGRLEMGQMDEKRHFSMIAASWYWHFVDVIWILLFFSIYLI